ncbi:hypothetical protein CEP88_07420 [Roseobacter denitrificans]|uniref:Uncharacterized protein n=1 Tax=Roseobacter denitrificans (strain ATCC 33942 / OCh 114) TaxID=375451 RepID=Q162N3_ROSDO|nr:hypothetical protein RD1_3580 [Roseobacter denitrificans OCh 114]AVL54831.1 hypothetical protein CEP88_07420 [Roseobacter denitrificans]SFG08659.1 hypothetical protein SAMN05443635_10784 [Roseobacter denitrificans OCh 114]
MITPERSNSGNPCLIVNCALLLCTLTVAFATSLFVISQASAVTHAQTPVPPQVQPDNQITHLLHEAKNELDEKDRALEALRDQLTNGYVVAKDIDVTQSDKAYWLSEPKLMLGVSRLSGGSLLISFADQQEIISIGERIDFKVDDCDCFLLLKSSTFGHASFRYACTPTTQEPIRNVQDRFIDAKLN